MKTVIEMAREAGFLQFNVEGWHKEFDVLVNLVREEERKACAIRSNPVNDEIIAELWHKAGGHLHRFARLLEQFMADI